MVCSLLSIGGLEGIKSWRPSPANPPSRHILVCLPLYNEPFREVMATLMDLERCRKVASHRHRVDMTVVLVQDGVGMMAPDTKDGLTRLLGPEAMPETCPPAAHRCEVVKVSEITVPVTFQSIWSVCKGRPTHDGNKAAAVSDGIRLIAMIKDSNRRKHNSQMWFFRLAAQLDSDYVLLTDCGTRFDRSCLSALLDGLQVKSGVPCLGAGSRKLGGKSHIAICCKLFLWLSRQQLENRPEAHDGPIPSLLLLLLAS